ncbi:uncharacterized protein MONBRDRAFT_9031 [Monosiga brevicollis MX1]|uniref:Uncharacterized protein n=1 Tax=Monosiga brevicollis TaxID=81824 RepID=A9V1V9_MONBE|nr:uncharacterized protein MONBRDRAFT_9031 [Monosiga brevicollis MX1]EDQ88630.1 predicted protein [Monosiga brevicollis MX1]|eukprot:XP_001746734.1 hypothetical protein [Monosiga brevicollis MX1]
MAQAAVEHDELASVIAAARLAIPSRRDASAPAWERLLYAAWREERRRPDLTRALAEAAAQEAATLSPVGLAKSHFLLGKVAAEAGGDAGVGIVHICTALRAAAFQTILVRPTDTQPRSLVLTQLEVCGWLYHLSRLLHNQGQNRTALAIQRGATERLFPSSWPPGDARGNDAEGSPTLKLLHVREWWQPVMDAASSAEPNKYHQGMLLHAFVLQSVTAPAAAQHMAPAIAHLLDQHRAQLIRQYSAEVRYAVCLARLLPWPKTELATKALYLLGDSHILPMAWTSVPVCPPGHVVMHPRLAMGVKAWHFTPNLPRPSIHRATLLAAAASIPADSIVIVSAGEIDLREDGTIVASPKHFGPHRPPKYPDLESAIAATLQGFVAGLQDLQCQHGWRQILLHPVRPIPPSHSSPDGRRLHHVIQQWNDSLAQRVQSIPGIAVLDFFSSLLDSSGHALWYVDHLFSDLLTKLTCVPA